MDREPDIELMKIPRWASKLEQLVDTLVRETVETKGELRGIKFVLGLGFIGTIILSLFGGR